MNSAMFVLCIFIAVVHVAWSVKEVNVKFNGKDVGKLDIGGLKGNGDIAKAVLEMVKGKGITESDLGTTYRYWKKSGSDEEVRSDAEKFIMKDYAEGKDSDIKFIHLETMKEILFFPTNFVIDNNGIGRQRAIENDIQGCGKKFWVMEEMTGAKLTEFALGSECMRDKQNESNYEFHKDARNGTLFTEKTSSVFLWVFSNFKNLEKVYITDKTKPKTNGH